MYSIQITYRPEMHSLFTAKGSFGKNEDCDNPGLWDRVPIN